MRGHVVLLSDGRPGDTKDALKVFQELLVRGRYAGTRLHGIGFGGSTECFVALQQLACVAGGKFTLSGHDTHGLCNAFASVTSTITSIKESIGEDPPASWRTARQVDFEPPENAVFGKRGVLRFRAKRSSFRYDGQIFDRLDWPAGPVERRQRPYMRGGMRLVYGFSDAQVADQKSGGWMVAKLSRFSDPRLNSVPIAEAHAKSTAVARHFASIFGEEAQKAAAGADIPSIIFVPCFVYTAEDPAACSAEEPAALTAERYLPGAFLKYNSNNGYIGERSLRHHDAVQAFLHFSFVKSGGSIAVTDLQGVARESEVLLTDPQVVTVNGGSFGPGDLGAPGLKACLLSHRCGPTCRKLGLTPISSSVLRTLAPRLRPAGGRTAGSSALSVGSWERLGSDVESERADWERLSERDLIDMAVLDDVRSQASGSSWVRLG